MALLSLPVTPRQVRTSSSRRSAFRSFILWGVFTFLSSSTVSGESSSMVRSVARTTNPSNGKLTDDNDDPTRASVSAVEKSSDEKVKIVFSDVDGTLVHYPAEVTDGDDGNRILRLPPSVTGVQGVISSKTLAYCQELRRSHGKKLVLISGMRTTTLLQRLPFLPRADAYCSESGGRIFYPTAPDASETGMVFQLVPYDGAHDQDLVPFGLQEDMEWRGRMERPDAAGAGGYDGSGDIAERQSLLWDFARAMKEKGFILDTKGYATSFRINRKQQTNSISNAEFDSLVLGTSPHPEGLATSTNLGCVDFYPIDSGKKNCCTYLARNFCETQEDDVLSKHAVCLCDDDNDLEMALACRHAYVPDVSSTSMANVIMNHPSKVTVTGGPDNNSKYTAATEKALELILTSIHTSEE